MFHTGLNANFRDFVDDGNPVKDPRKRVTEQESEREQNRRAFKGVHNFDSFCFGAG
jgi:hypothetical protein